MNSQLTVDTLLDLFFERTGKVSSTSKRRQIKRQICEYQDKGISLSLLEEAFNESGEGFREYIKSHNTVQIAKPVENKPDNGKGLLNSKFYYHPQLQIAPPPPMITINDDGSFSESKTEFFLKLKGFYTIEDTVEYFYLRFPDIGRNQKRDTGAMDYVYKKACETISSREDEDLQGLDLLLFTIDSAAVLSYDTDCKVKSPLNLTNYIDDGMAVYLDKRDACIYAGLNHEQ